MTNKRIDDFIKVASQRYDANPVVWEQIYNQLRGLLPKEDKDELERQWCPIVHKKDLEEWDELFLEATIDEAKVADQFGTLNQIDAQKRAYELYRQQQIAGMQNANPYQSYTTTTGTGAGAIYPVATNTAPTRWR